MALNLLDYLSQIVHNASNFYSLVVVSSDSETQPQVSKKIILLFSVLSFEPTSPQPQVKLVRIWLLPSSPAYRQFYPYGTTPIWYNQ